MKTIRFGGLIILDAVAFRQYLLTKKRYYISLETIQKIFQKKKRLCLIKRIRHGKNYLAVSFPWVQKEQL